VQGTAGMYGGEQQIGQASSNTIANLLSQMKKNFIDRKIEMMPGLLFNQYEMLKTIHFYINSKFEGGDIDENGNDRFFHNLINHRNTHSTKNIDLDTKDLRVTSDLDGKEWATEILRMELREWAREAKFAMTLNQLAEDLPKFGSVVWKKVICEEKERGKVERKVVIKNVDLRDLLVDQTVDCLKESQIVAERMVMSAKEIYDKIADGWDEEEVKLLLQGSPVKKDQYMKSGASVDNSASYSLTDVLPSQDVYEVWGWIPRQYLPEKFRPENCDLKENLYVMAIVGGVDGSVSARTLFCEEAKEENFPYKDVHMRKTPGRWLGIGNTELLIPLQIRANELVNRFFMALRLGSVHLFQTRGQLSHKNLLQDVQDGDIIESSHPIESIQTEIRAFNQYQNEMQMIEALADRICNTPEVVTGESMPAATPFRLGAQLGTSAAKIFDFIRENCGIFVGDVVREWVLEDLNEHLTSEHVLSLIGTTEELEAFQTSYRKSVLYEQVKKYVLDTGYLPAEDEFKVAEKALSDQMKSNDKKIKVEQAFLDDEFLDNVQIVVDPTGETEDPQVKVETLGNVLQIISSNPMIMQDPNTKWIVAKLLESSGISPMRLAGFASAPPDPMAGIPGAASPAMQKFAANSGDADPNAAVPGAVGAKMMGK